MLEAARAGQGSLSFGALHALSSALLRAQVAAGGGAGLAPDARRRAERRSALLLLLDAGDALPGALQLAAGGQAHVAQHLDLLDLRPVVAALGELEHLDHLRARASGLRARPSPSAAARARSTSSLPMCWTGAALSARAQLAEQGLAGGAVVGEDADLDQAVRLSAASSSRRTAAVAALAADRGPPGPGDGRRRASPCARRARGGGRSRPYYRCEDGDEDRHQEQEGQQGVAARPPDRSLREAGAARGLPRPRRLQAEGDRRGAAPAQAGPVRRRPGRRARAPGASTCGASSAAAPLPARPSPARCEGTIIALDLLEFEPIEGVDFIQGDFREPRSWPRWRRACGGRQVDVVLSDMAPNLSGIASADAARMAELVELAIEFARRHLVAEGALVCKGVSRQRLQPAREALQGRVPGRQADQAQGLAGQVGGNLPRRHRSQAGVHPGPIFTRSPCFAGRYIGRGLGA